MYSVGNSSLTVKLIDNDQNFLSLQNVKLLSVGKDLEEALDKTEDKCLPYTAVTGFVVADRAPLKSNNDQLGRTGVIHNVITAEHKSEWNKTSNSW